MNIYVELICEKTKPLLRWRYDFLLIKKHVFKINALLWDILVSLRLAFIYFIILQNEFIFCESLLPKTIRSHITVCNQVLIYTAEKMKNE